MFLHDFSFFLFFFNDTAPTEIYTLSLHDALPIWITNLGAIFDRGGHPARLPFQADGITISGRNVEISDTTRSEEHTSELQSQSNLVCRLLLEKKKNTKTNNIINQL